MRSITSADAKINFGAPIALARAAPIAVTKYDRVAMAAEEYRGLTGLKRRQNPAKRLNGVPQRSLRTVIK